MNAIITAEMLTIQTATHTRSKRIARVGAAEGLMAAALHDLASAVEAQEPGALENARRFLTRALRSNVDRSPRVIQSLRAALEAVGKAWAWELTDTEAL